MDSRIIDAKLKHLRQSIQAAAWPIETWEARLGDHAAPERYTFDQDWAATQDESWWPAGKTLFLRQRVQAPAGIHPDDLYLLVEMEGLEGLLRINGRPYSGIDANHPLVALPLQGEQLAGELSLEFEFMCLGAVLYHPELRGEKARLKGIAFVQIDRDIRRAYYDLWFTWEASRSAKDERRRRLLHAALEEALLLIDLTAPPAEYRQQVAAARTVLQQRTAAIAPDPEAGQIVLTGHSHIDTAWLWPLRETIRKVGRTFSTACRLLERYPDYHFSCSQPQLYAYAKQFYPELYLEIQGWVKTGRWECTGGMWVEADCNVPSGEALVRQMLYGMEFFQAEFGITPQTCWLPDVFGYPASLPEILSGCGLKYFYTNKLHWQARNPFPTSTFWWEGLDGSRVLAHIPKLKDYYNGWPNPEQLNTAWDNYLEKPVYPELLFPFGFGDGGGGPTEEMLEFAGRAASFPGLPATTQELEEAYFDRAMASGAAFPTWSGELYLETHRGTYTTQSRIKKANRQSELLLREAEIFGMLARSTGAEVDLAPLKPAWLNLVLLQFHDILPGSSIGEVYQEAAADHARIQSAARQVRSTSLAALTSPSAPLNLVAFNSLSWARSDTASAVVTGLEYGPGEACAVRQPDGTILPAQVTARRGSGSEVIFPLHDLPSYGYRAYTLQEAAAPFETSLRAGPRRLENRFFILELGEDGALTRLFDKRARREVLPAGASANQFQLFQDGPEREAAWNVHDTLDRREYPWEGETNLAVSESGPVRAALRVEKHYRGSRLVQEIRLYDHLPRIDFATRVHWEERQVLLKAAFPLDIRSPRAAFEIQYGMVERPTHRNTSWEQEKFEVCGHHWADLSETGYGASLLNDCKYGYDVKGDTLRLTLLRGTQFPDPEADRGDHEFTYALLPHLGDASQGETAQRGWELNVPVVCAAGYNPRTGLSAEQAFFTIQGPAILDTLKPAEDGRGWILRLYEPYGSRGQVDVHGPFPLNQVIACNHVEEDAGALPFSGPSFSFTIRPFEIKTFRLI